MLALAWACLTAFAADLRQISVTRHADGVYLSAAVDAPLAPVMEDALQKSVPLYFVVQADVYRERWYWADKRVASASRTYRLAYQPLSRHWRVSMSHDAGVASSLQYALHQNYSSIEQAMSGITRIGGWQIAQTNQVDAGGEYWVDFRFKLDMALLPRLFQMGLPTQSEWSLEVRKRVVLPDSVMPEPAQGEGPLEPAVTTDAATGAAGGHSVVRLP